MGHDIRDVIMSEQITQTNIFFLYKEDCPLGLLGGAMQDEIYDSR